MNAKELAKVGFCLHIFQKFVLVSLCCIYCDDEGHSQQSDWWYSRKCWHHYEGMHSYNEGPQRRPAERLQSCQFGTQSSWTEKKRLRGDKGWERERNWLPFAPAAVIYQMWSKVLHWASVTRWVLCVPTSLSALLFRRIIFWGNQEFPGFGFGWL